MKQLFLMATMLLMFGAANAQVCGHLEIKNNNLYKGIQKSMITNIKDMWDWQLITENVDSYAAYQTSAYWRCTVIVLKKDGNLYKYTIDGENKGLLYQNVSKFSGSGDFINVTLKDGSNKMLMNTD